MRWAFFAGGDPGEDSLDGVLRLTRGQASRGGPVHADVPQRRTCCACGGRGETWGERCAVCAGQGEAVTRRTMEILVPPGVPDGARLRLRLGVRGSAGPDVAVRLLVSVR
jgi:DnaJ-class molecular chaperone